MTDMDFAVMLEVVRHYLIQFSGFLFLFAVAFLVFFIICFCIVPAIKKTIERKRSSKICKKYQLKKPFNFFQSISVYVLFHVIMFLLCLIESVCLKFKNISNSLDQFYQGD